MINTFYKDYLKKSIATSLLIDPTPSIAKPTAKPMAKLLYAIKRKYDQLAKTSVK